MSETTENEATRQTTAPVADGELPPPEAPTAAFLDGEPLGDNPPTMEEDRMSETTENEVTRQTTAPAAEGELPPPGAPTAASPNGEPLGDGGRRAIDAERRARRDAERRARDAEERVAALELDQVRRQVAAERGLTEAQAEFLGDGTAEEMAARADALLAAFAPAAGKVRRRPMEHLRSGTLPGIEPVDPGRIADAVMRSI